MSSAKESERPEEGAVVRATVRNLTEYGVFVDLGGGLQGLLHITDMAWKRITHPSEIVKVGDQIQVMILRLNLERSRASVGLKQLRPDPWINISQRYRPHTRVCGTVTGICEYGAFVEVEEGVEGLVHVSDMDWNKRRLDPATVVYAGQQVEVMVLDVDEPRRRLSLGLKQCKPAEHMALCSAQRRWPIGPWGRRAVRAPVPAEEGEGPEGRDPWGSGYRWPQALDHEPCMRDAREGFTGRLWLFEEIQTWLACEEGSPALLLTADSGVGKSAFLSEYVHRFRGRGVLAWHFCEFDRPETLQPGAWVRSLAAQLAERIPEYRQRIESSSSLQTVLDEADSHPKHALAEAVMEPLAGLPPPEATQLLVVDGLDVSLEGAAGPGLVDLLDDAVKQLPPWLRLLAASRPAPEILSRLHAGFRMHEISATDVCNRDDLWQHAMELGPRLGLWGSPGAKGTIPSAPALFVCDRSGGSFLSLRCALRELASGMLSMAMLWEIPPGIEGLYGASLGRRLGETAHDGQTSVLWGVMCAAREPLSAAELAQILDISESQVLGFQERMAGFIKLRIEKQRALLSFEHVAIRDWLTATAEGGTGAQAFAVDPAQASWRLRRWAVGRTAAGTAHLSSYLLRHLATHLKDDAERQAVYQQLLLSSFEWSQAQLNLAGVRGLLGDVEHLGAQWRAQVLRELIQRAAPALRASASQWPAQVLGRLGVGPWNVALPSLAAAAQRWASTQGHGVLVPLRPSLSLEGGPFKLLNTGQIVALPGGRIGYARGNYVCVCDAASGAEPQVLKGHTRPVTSLAALPDGRLVSGSFDKSVRVWSLDGSSAQVLKGHRYGVTTLAVLPDGRVVSGSRDKSLRVWSLKGGASQVLEGHTAAITALAVLPDGRVVSGSGRRDKSVRIWSLDGTAPHVLEGHAGLVSALAVLPDGRVVSGSTDKTVRVWSPEGHACEVLEGHTRAITALAVLADGRVVSAAWDESVRLWSLEGGACQRLEAGPEGVTALAILPDARLVTGGGGGLRVWSVEAAAVQLLEKHAACVTGLAVLPGGRVAAATAATTLRVWSLEDGAAQVLDGQLGGASALAAMPDGRVASGSYDGSVRLWRVEGGAAQVFEGHTGLVTALAALPDGRVLSASKDGSVRLWSPDGSSQVHRDTANAFGLLPDGRVVLANGAELRVWSLDGGAVQVLKGHTLSATAVAVLPDGRIASASWDRTVRVWSLDGARAQVLEGHTDEVTALVVLPDGRLVSGSRDKSLRVWSLDGADTRVLEGHAGAVTALGILPDGRLVSGSRDKSVRVWSPTFEIQHSFIADDPISALAVTPAGVIVAGCENVHARSEYGPVHILRLPPSLVSLEAAG